MQGLLIAGIATVISVTIGALLDAIVPGLALNGFNFQGVVWYSVCAVFSVWLLYKLDLLG